MSGPPVPVVKTTNVRDQRGALFDPKMVETFLDVTPYRSVAAG